MRRSCSQMNIQTLIKFRRRTARLRLHIRGENSLATNISSLLRHRLHRRRRRLRCPFHSSISFILMPWVKTAFC